MKKTYKLWASALVLFCLSLIIWSCESSIAPTAETVTVKGVLADKQGNAIPFAIVNIYDTKADKTVLQADKLLAKDTTDEDGKYELKNIPSVFDNLNFVADHSDFKNYTVKLNDVKSNIKENQLQLKMENKSECGFNLNFSIIDSANQQAVPETQIRLNREGVLIRKTLTNSTGSFNFQGVCPGVYSYRIAKNGYRVIESTVTIGGTDSNTSLVLAMRNLAGNTGDSCCDGIAKFAIKNSKGSYVVGTKVKLTLGNFVKEVTVTSSTEPLNVTNLCEGAYGVRISAEGYNTVETSANVSCKESITVSKLLSETSTPTDSCCDGIAKIFVKNGEGNYIIGAKVKLSQNGTVKSDGTVTSGSEPLQFKNLCEGTYHVVITAEGYNPIEFDITVSCKEPATSTKILVKKTVDSCCDGKANITVKDANGNFIVGAKVKLVLNGKVIKEITTGSEGISLKDLCEGKYRLLITIDGYTGSESDLTISCAEPANANKILNKITTDSCCNAKAKIAVRDSSGNLILGAKVQLVLNGKVIKEILTNANEPLNIDGLCEGKYRLLITAEGYTGSESDLVISCKEPADVTKVLTKKSKEPCCDATAKIYVKDANGNLILGAGVKLVLNGKVIKELKTNANEPLNITGLCEGTYRLLITVDGYEGSESDLVISCKEPANVTKILAKKTQDTCCNGIFKLFVKDGEGRYLVGATVKLYFGSKVIKEILVTSDMEPITFTGLCEGKYSVSITDDGYKGVEGAVTVSCKEPVSLTKVLAKNACCDGVAKIFVKNGEGKYIIGAKVKLVLNGTTIKELTVTSDNEPITVTGLCEGNYRLLVTAEGFTESESDLTISCATPANVTKVLTKKTVDSCCTATLKFHVITADSLKAISGATVTIKVGSTVLQTGTTNGDGNWTSSQLCNNTYTVVISRDGFNDKTLTWTVGIPCAALQETFKLEKK